MANYWTQKRFRERGVKASNIPDLLAQGVPADQLFIQPKIKADMATAKKNTTMVSLDKANKAVKNSPNKTQSRPTVKTLAKALKKDGMDRSIKSTPAKLNPFTKIVSVHFEDKGQDFTRFDIAYTDDYMFGKVIGVSPFQYGIWGGMIVLSGKPAKNKALTVSKSPNDPVLTLKYKVTKVVFDPPLFLFHLHVKPTKKQEMVHDYYDSAVVCALDKNDACRCVDDITQSWREFVNAKKLVVDLIGAANSSTARGLVTASFNAG